MINLLSFFVKKHPGSPFERLSHSERQLTDYKKLSTSQKIKQYTTLLQPAIRRAFTILKDSPHHQYENFWQLETDYTFTDVGIMSYFDQDGQLAHETLRKSLMLKYPDIAYKVEDGYLGLCLDENGDKFFCQRIAIETYLELLTDRWLEEIPKIREIIDEQGK